MDKKMLIEKLYFEEKITLTEIAKKLDITVGYVTRILKQNENYITEKESRKKENQTKRREKQKELIYKKRKSKQSNQLSYQALINSHVQASRELSKSSAIGIQALKKWNSSAYKFDAENNRYEFDAGSALRPNDFPKYIKI